MQHIASVEVTTGARLHCGLLANPVQGRSFGGVGLMVDQPGFILRASLAEQDEFAGPPEWVERARLTLHGYRERCPTDRQPPPVRIQILRGLPPHVGLGSGTQLGMAVAHSLALLTGEEVSAAALAVRAGRGGRSSLGIHGFFHGGLLIESGKQAQDSLGPLASRVELPAAWRIVLIRPEAASGLYGTAERSAFSTLPPMPAATTERLCKLVLLGLVPAAIEEDLEACGEALYEIGRQVGEYFAPAQGGVYAHPLMARMVNRLRQAGVHGVGQTSWGPTLFALCADDDAAADVVSRLFQEDQGETCEYRVVAPLNSGARVAAIPGEIAPAAGG